MKNLLTGLIKETKEGNDFMVIGAPNTDQPVDAKLSHGSVSIFTK